MNLGSLILDGPEVVLGLEGEMDDGAFMRGRGGGEGEENRLDAKEGKGAMEDDADAEADAEVEVEGPASACHGTVACTGSHSSSASSTESVISYIQQIKTIEYSRNKFNPLYWSGISRCGCSESRSEQQGQHK